LETEERVDVLICHYDDNSGPTYRLARRGMNFARLVFL
jgi:hypothetical protein